MNMITTQISSSLKTIRSCANLDRLAPCRRLCRARRGDAEAALALGAARVLAKPFKRDEFLRALCRLGQPMRRAASRAGEVVDSAFHTITLAIALHRVDRIVIGCLRFKAVHAHAKDCLCMILI